MTSTARPDTDYNSTDGLPDAAAKGLRDQVLACADTKLLLGYHYGEWTFGPPELEAAVANCSLSQTELGHVRLLHAVLKKHYGDDPDALVDERDAGAFANVSYLDNDLPDWPAYVAANFLVDVAVTRVLHAMLGSAFKPLRMSLEKMVDEERYHAHHATGWFRTVANRGDEERAALATRAQEALESVIVWLGPDDDEGDKALVETGIKSTSNVDVRDAMVEEILGLAGSLDVSLQASIPDDWSGWDPATRRFGAAQLSNDILYHLRGGGNTIFKLA